MFSEDHLYSIALRRCSLVGDVVFRRLVEAHGSAENVWKMPGEQLQSVFGIGRKTTRGIGDEEQLRFAEKEIEFCQKNKVKILLRHQRQLPYHLGDCEDAPAILYQKGETDPARKPLSIVGTRTITPYGRQFISDFLKEIKSENIVTVSGLALGADAEAHRHSLENGIPTIGVLAHGFHTLYPSQNRYLAQEILDNGGALLTEFNTSQKPDRENFIQRNRIVAGLSPATIVVETAFGGGSISTATFANGYNRDVFALPGKITDRYSQGCNQLIASNKAGAIATLAGLRDNLHLCAQERTAELFHRSEIRVALDETQQQVFDVIKNHPQINLDDLAEKLGTATYKVLPVLLQLEISGCIRTFSGRQYAAV